MSTKTKCVQRISLITESGLEPKAVEVLCRESEAGGEIKRGHYAPPFSLLWLRKLIGRYVCWFGRRNIVDRHL